MNDDDFKFNQSDNDNSDMDSNDNGPLPPDFLKFVGIGSLCAFLGGIIFLFFKTEYLLFVIIFGVVSIVYFRKALLAGEDANIKRNEEWYDETPYTAYGEYTNTQKNWHKVMNVKCPKCGNYAYYDSNEGKYTCNWCNHSFKKKNSIIRTILVVSFSFVFFLGTMFIVFEFYDVYLGLNSGSGIDSYEKEDESYTEMLKPKRAETEIAKESVAVETESSEVATTETGKVLTDSRKADLSQIDSTQTEYWEFSYKMYDGLYEGRIYMEQFPVGAAKYYKTLSRYYDISEWKNYLDDEVNKMLCNSLAEAFRSAAESDFEAIEKAIAFMQTLDYIPDGDGVEYPKYPIETLYDKGGDCEDKAILLCGIIRSMGYGSTLLIFDDHCAVGIAGSNLDGTYYENGGTKYFYTETTACGWRIGDIPDQYKNESARMILVQ